MLHYPALGVTGNTSCVRLRELFDTAGGQVVRYSADTASAGDLQCAWSGAVLPGCRESGSQADIR